ncbi:MAG: methionine adenosyltransferase [Planctomycetota bacterium]
MTKKRFFTSESVSEGHPDKVADQISDSVLDAIIEQDKACHVACETLVTTGMALVAGEITTSCYVDIPQIVRDTVRKIGYTDPRMGFDYKSCAILTSIDKQSPDIAMGLDERRDHEMGAGDQGIMFGYACDETKELMPMPLMYSHKLLIELARIRKAGELNYLRPDSKSQVTIEYEGYKPVRVEAVVISTQHTPEVNGEEKQAAVKQDMIERVIKKVIPANMLDAKTKYFVNPTGQFEKGGPATDCGVTGRKIIVDTYGGMGSHGGGAFSGKDPSKVDRTASYMGRHIAKNIVAAGLADRIEIQLAYAIGVAEPVSIMIDTFDTGKVGNGKLVAAVRELFPLKPRQMIEYLNLLRPIFCKTAAYGHFGRDDEDFTWEKTNKVADLKRAMGA